MIFTHDGRQHPERRAAQAPEQEGRLDAVLPLAVAACLARLVEVAAAAPRQNRRGKSASNSKVTFLRRRGEIVGASALRAWGVTWDRLPHNRDNGRLRPICKTQSTAARSYATRSQR